MYYKVKNMGQANQNEICIPQFLMCTFLHPLALLTLLLVALYKQLPIFHLVHVSSSV
jgi:hypothetical protein